MPDWQDRLLAPMKLEGDALKAAQTELKKFSNPTELLRARTESERRAAALAEQQKTMLKPLTKDSKPEEVKAFREALGVPESPDKYAIPERPKDLGELSQEELAPFMKTFNEHNMTQDQVSAVLTAYAAYEQNIRHNMGENAKAGRKEAETDLRTHFVSPQAYDSAIELSNRFLQENLGRHMPDSADRQAFLSLPLADGRSLGDHPAFVKFVHDIATGNFTPIADHGSFVPSEQSGGQDPAGRMKEIMRLAHTGKPADEAEYKRLQPELTRIIERMNRQKAR